MQQDRRLWKIDLQVGLSIMENRPTKVYNVFPSSSLPRFLTPSPPRCFHHVSRITHHVPHAAPLGLNAARSSIMENRPTSGIVDYGKSTYKSLQCLPLLLASPLPHPLASPVFSSRITHYASRSTCRPAGAKCSNAPHHASRLSKIRPVKDICQPLTPPMQKVLIYSLGITRRDLRCQGSN